MRQIFDDWFYFVLTWISGVIYPCTGREPVRSVQFSFRLFCYCLCVMTITKYFRYIDCMSYHSLMRMHFAIMLVEYHIINCIHEHTTAIAHCMRTCRNFSIARVFIRCHWGWITLAIDSLLDNNCSITSYTRKSARNYASDLSFRWVFSILSRLKEIGERHEMISWGLISHSYIIQ